jgi:ferredoxin-type protein NapG
MAGFGWDLPSSIDPAPRRRVARAIPDACVAEERACDACATRCPAGAITFEADRPRVDETRCDGCGACERACPAPGGAIVCVPRRV